MHGGSRDLGRPVTRKDHLLKLPAELGGPEGLHDAISFLVELRNVVRETGHGLFPAGVGGIDLAHSTGVAALKRQKHIEIHSHKKQSVGWAKRGREHSPVMTARARMRATAFMVITQIQLWRGKNYV